MCLMYPIYDIVIFVARPHTMLDFSRASVILGALL